jgi:hypothetical protein
MAVISKNICRPALVLPNYTTGTGFNNNPAEISQNVEEEEEPVGRTRRTCERPRRFHVSAPILLWLQRCSLALLYSSSF